MNTTKVLNGEICSGDLVIAVPDDNYGCLIGSVIKIIPLGSPERDTDNETDDIYVNFAEADYSDERKNEIVEKMGKLYGETKSFDELSLDVVIMPPDSLIRITDINCDMYAELLKCSEAAEIYCYLIIEK